MKKILCFGDSNTWGYNPADATRFGEGIRWTSILQGKLAKEVEIIEEGLCGRTTIFEDKDRPNRKGVDSLEQIFRNLEHIDSVILMLGTNDCKSFYNTTEKKIVAGIEECLNIVLKHVPPENILLISPIHLGKDVWRKEYDPEFDERSVKISYRLKKEYKRLADNKKVRFLAASDYVEPSCVDQEHLDGKAHAIFADVVYHRIKECA